MSVNTKTYQQELPILQNKETQKFQKMNTVTSAKIQVAPKGCPNQKDLKKNQTKTLRVNVERTLENNQRLTAAKKMMNQEKCNYKLVGKFCGILTISPTPPQYRGSL